MLNRKPFKVQDRNPHNRRGVVANSLEELRDVGCRKLNLDIDNLQSLRLEDGTIVDDEEYFQFLPDHAVIIFLKENEEWNSSKSCLVLNNCTSYLFSFFIFCDLV